MKTFLLAAAGIALLATPAVAKRHCVKEDGSEIADVKNRKDCTKAGGKWKRAHAEKAGEHKGAVEHSGTAAEHKGGEEKAGATTQEQMEHKEGPHDEKAHEEKAKE